MVPVRYLISFAACLMIFACAVLVNAQAEPFVDECDKLEQTPQKNYVNFMQNIDDFAKYSAWSSCGDRTALSMTANKAWVIYHVSNAERLYVELYSNGGTFATNDKAGNYQIGLRDMSEFSSVHRCQYQQSEDKVYIRQNGLTYSLKSSYSMLNFVEDPVDFSKNEPYYGINAEVSSDGINYRSLELNFSKILWQNYENYGNHFREFYDSDLPAGTAYIKLTLYGYNRIPGEWGDLFNYPFLSKVKITRTEPASSSTPSSSEDPSSSKPSPNESSSSESSKGPVSNGAPDCENHPQSSLSNRLVRKKSIKIDQNHSDNILKEEVNCPVDPSKNRNFEKSEKQREFQVQESEEEILQPSNLIESETEDQSLHKLQSLYQEKPNQSKEVVKGLAASGMIISTITALIFLIKPH